MRKFQFYCMINLKPAFTLEIIVLCIVVLLMGPAALPLFLASVAITICSLHILLLIIGSEEYKSPEELLSELESMLKQGTSADPDHESSAVTDISIWVIMNQLQDAEHHDESQKTQFICKAYELIDSYRPWYKVRPIN